MVVDANSFYGKRKNDVSLMETSIIKYESLKKIKVLSDINADIKKKKFYKQREAFSYYESLKQQLHSEILSKNVLVYTEELENSKRSFIVESFSSFLQFYCAYSLDLDTIYFEEMQTEEERNKTQENEVKQLKEKSGEGKETNAQQENSITSKLFERVEEKNPDICDHKKEEKTVVENMDCLKREAKREYDRVKEELEPQYHVRWEKEKTVEEKKETHYKEEIRKKGNSTKCLNLYELIVASEKRWLYFDIEYECNSENGNKKQVILFIFLIEFCLFVYKKFHIKLNLIDFLILDSSTKQKVSFHIIIKNIHDVPNDYMDHLIDYCFFYLMESHLPENNFYKKYKSMGKISTDEEGKTKKNYLLFDNEEILKYFVELFINKIIKKINKTENVHMQNSQMICLDYHHTNGNSLEKEEFYFVEEEISSEEVATNAHKEKDTHTNLDYSGNNINSSISSHKSSNISVSISSSSINSANSRNSNMDNDLLHSCNRNNCDADKKRGQGGENDTQIKEENKKQKKNKESLKKQYFEICKHSLKEVIEYYINKFQKNSKNPKKFNYIILLYAVKKRELEDYPNRKHIDGQNSVKKKSAETISAEDRYVERRSIEKRSVEKNFFDKRSMEKELAWKEKSKEETKKGRGTTTEVKKAEKEQEGSTSDEELKKDIEWFIKNDDSFFETENDDIYNCHNNNMEERFILQCVIDSSVYSRNRNFRMIFSSKKNKENKLLLSPMNVKKYNKRNINDVILKSLITFYKNEDITRQIKKERIYKYKETEVYKFHLLRMPNQMTQIYRKRILKNENMCKCVTYENLSESHLNNILKIIFFWNFLLYKNFKENKTYLKKFRAEIEKEYFYKIIVIYNNFNFKIYEEYVNFFQKTRGNEEIYNNHPPLKKSGGTDKTKISNADALSTYLDNFDKLFLDNVNFFEDVLKTYKKYFNLKEEEDHRIYFLRYFLYWVTVKDNEYTLFFRDNKYCRNKNFSHKSNHIYLIYNIRYRLFIQKCYDEDCQHFVSDIFQF